MLNWRRCHAGRLTLCASARAIQTTLRLRLPASLAGMMETATVRIEYNDERRAGERSIKIESKARNFTGIFSAIRHRWLYRNNHLCFCAISIPSRISGFLPDFHLWTAHGFFTGH
jgi:hypothetical protein